METNELIWEEKINTNKNLISVIIGVLGIILITVISFSTIVSASLRQSILLIGLVGCIIAVLAIIFIAKVLKKREWSEQYFRVYKSGIFIGNNYKNEFIDWEQIEYISIGIKNRISGRIKSSFEKQVENFGQGVEQLLGLTTIVIHAKSINPLFKNSFIFKKALKQDKDFLYNRFVTIQNVSSLVSALNKINKDILIK